MRGIENLGGAICGASWLDRAVEAGIGVEAFDIGTINWTALRVAFT